MPTNIASTRLDLGFTAVALLGLAVGCGSPSVNVGNAGGSSVGANSSVGGSVGSGGVGAGASSGGTEAGGSPATGGITGVGGSVSSGGESAAGGSAATGGGGGASGGTASGGAPSGGSGGGANSGETSELSGLPEVTCSIEILSSALATIETVGDVTFSTSLPGVSAAEIEFGKDTTYGLIAPVNLSAANYRTLLLGMTQETTYNYRIAVSDGSQVCFSDNQTLQTGTLSQAGLGTVTTSAAAAKGFMITSRGNDVIIFNKAGELVWGHTFGGGVFRGNMSWDGQYMLGRDAGNFDSATGGTIFRVNIDGSGATSFDVPSGDHHDLTPIPGGFAYMGKLQAGQCDHVFTVDNDGQNQVDLIDLWDVFSHFENQAQSEVCHSNFIRYSSDGDFYTVSDREKDALGFFNGDGSVITSVGTTPQDTWTQHLQAEGASTTWRVQHGHHWYADDKLLVFTNGSMSGGTSKILHYTLGAGTATLDWEYADAGKSGTQGDVMALPNGNFLVTASNVGVIHELDASRSLVGSYNASGGTGAARIGYTAHRPTLYGPPPGR